MKRYVQRILQWLGLSVSPTWGSSLILGWGTKSPQASQCGKKKKKKDVHPKFTAGLFTIAKIRKQPKCPSVDK